ncbi:hypothetical protein CGZ75_08735 [Paenibacillus herberti]|uniref:Cache domain-containing protein n=2 Tax=Paenibacillus herberti TaxID=1619309 RepID=A0A229P3M5_9BACL|nr:hypothetical protein CGZ75_08735 [Paenibacillus herberti]
MNKTLGDINRISRMPLYSDDIRKIVMKYAMDQIDFPDPKDQTYMNRYLVNLQYQHSDIRRITIFTEGNVYFTKSFISSHEPFIEPWKDQAWFQTVKSKKDPYVFAAERFVPEKEQFFTFARQIKNTENFDVIGVIRIDVDSSVIKKMIDISQVDNETEFMVFDEEGNLIYPNASHRLRQTIGSLHDFNQIPNMEKSSISINQEKFFLSRAVSKTSGWTVVAMVPQKSLLVEVDSIRKTTIIVVIVTLLIALISLAILVMQVTKVGRILDYGRPSPRLFNRSL